MADEQVEAISQPENENPTVEPEPGRDIIYTLRTAQQGQIQLNAMADQKANIIIAASLIFVSVTQSLIFSTGFIQSDFFLPIVIFCIMLIIACILAFLAVLPNLKQTRCDSVDQLDSPFFFGQYTQFSEDEYVSHMMGRLTNNQEAREALLHQIYQLGHVLKRKYTFLRYSYLSVTLGFFMAIVDLLINILLR